VIYTVGHSTRPVEELVELLEGAGVSRLADVRTVPRSRRNPQYERGALAGALAAYEIDYRHEGGLGGFRRPRPDSVNTAWRVSAFRGYADYMVTPEFAAARSRLEDLARGRTTAIMCAEAQWWRCHRRLIADALAIRGWEVLHLGVRGEPVEHELPSFAVVGADLSLTYPAAQAELPLD
jgi:uncharacterized protein (DUF488 family)